MWWRWGITSSLLKAGAKKVFVIEKGPRFLPSLNLLKEAASHERLEVHIGDCLSFNVEELVPGEARVPVGCCGLGPCAQINSISSRRMLYALSELC